MVDVDLLGDVVVGAVLHRSLATGVPDDAFVDGLIELLADVAYARLLLAKPGDEPDHVTLGGRFPPAAAPRSCGLGEWCGALRH